MKIHILTLFPEMCRAPLQESMMKRAQEKGLLEVNIVYIRDFAEGRHQVTDDYPFGGGAGLVMKPEPIFRAVDSVLEAPGRGSEKENAKPPRVILMSPQGETFTQTKAWELSKEDELIFLCGHYEGMDERVRTLVTDDISIGDYVLTGGELPALVVIDAVVRLIPGVISEESLVAESFADGVLEGPQYTRPREFRGLTVPEILLSGDHGKLRRWRRKEGLRRTLQFRPDLIERLDLSREDRELIREIREESERQSVDEEELRAGGEVREEADHSDR